MQFTLCDLHKTSREALALLFLKWENGGPEVSLSFPGSQNHKVTGQGFEFRWDKHQNLYLLSFHLNHQNMLSETAILLHSSKPTRCSHHPLLLIQAQPSLSDLLFPSERVGMSIRGHISQLLLLFVYSLRQGFSSVLLHICMGPVPQQAFNKCLLNEWLVTKLLCSPESFICWWILFVCFCFVWHWWLNTGPHTCWEVVYQWDTCPALYICF